MANGPSQWFSAKLASGPLMPCGAAAYQMACNATPGTAGGPQAAKDQTGLGHMQGMYLYHYTISPAPYKGSFTKYICILARHRAMLDSFKFYSLVRSFSE